MEQRSESWEEWRQKGIGSSDAPIIMCVSPWMTPFALWEQKTGRSKNARTNWAMERGNQLEPKARSHYELLSDIDMPAVLACHPKHEFLRASLDGYNKDKKRVLEIKCPGKEDHATAVKGHVPEKYIPQLQHQLLVTGAERVDYFSFYGESGVIVPVEPDLKYQNQLLELELSFWDLVRKDIPPELLDKDFKNIKDTNVVALCTEWKALKELKDQTEVKIEAAKEEILKAAGIKRFRCGDVQVSEVIRKGNVDYSKIQELKTVDLEKFRKKGTTYIDFRLLKAK